MKLAHIAIWTNNLETLRKFYVDYFQGKSNEKYINSQKGFASYFVTFKNGVSLEIMERKDITEKSDHRQTIGLTHLAFYVGNQEEVNKMVETFRNEGYNIQGEPRTTGDGFYEAVIEDPDGNQVELVACPEN